jgi:hypothetical protein
MSNGHHESRSLRERLPLWGGSGGATEERLGRALSDLLENPLLTGAVSRAFDAREKAAQAQEVAMGALNIPSAADIERLTRRLRSVSLRLEGIEESLDRLERALSGEQTDARGGSQGLDERVERRLSAIEQQLARLVDGLEGRVKPKQPTPGKTARRAAKAGAGERRRAEATRRIS